MCASIGSFLITCIVETVLMQQICYPTQTNPRFLFPIWVEEMHGDGKPKIVREA